MYILLAFSFLHKLVCAMDDSWPERPLWLHIMYSSTINRGTWQVPLSSQESASGTVWVWCSTVLYSACQVWKRQRYSLALWPIKQLFELLFCCGLFLLQESIVALSHTPAIGLRQRGTQGTTRGWLQVLPVVTAGSETEKKKKMLTCNSNKDPDVHL